MQVEELLEGGVRLLFMEQVAARAGVELSTIKSCQSAGKRARKLGKATLSDMPAARKHVTRTVHRADGRAVVVRSPVWREDRIDVWLANRRGPGGHILGREPISDQA
jgi:hypothetical protein